MKGIAQADRIEMAAGFIAGLSDGDLIAATVWKVMDCWRIASPNKAERLLVAEKLRRGLQTLADLTPDQRRAHADTTDLKAIASGPIMDPANIYLPAGKLSMAETRAREAAQVRP